MQNTGKHLIIIGVIVIVIGLILWLFGNKLGWLGNLPGDIKYENERTKIYFPITTMLLISALISIILWVVRKWLNVF